MIDHDWRHQAACSDASVNPDWFFPGDTYQETRSNYAHAKKVCAMCPVIDVCLKDSHVLMDMSGLPDPTHGIAMKGFAGGLSYDDRRRVTVRRAS